METDLEYQNTRAFDRDVFNAMFRVQNALHDDEDESPAATERWDRSHFEAWQRSRQVPNGPKSDHPAPPPASDDEPGAPLAPPAASETVLADVLDQRALQETARNRLAAARTLHEQAVEIRRQLLGEADPNLSQSFTWLGNLALREGHLDEARWLHEQARQVIEKLYGPEHLQLAVPLHNLAVTARHSGDLVLAADLYEQALALKLEHLGWMHPSVATTLTNLGNLARHTGDLQAALCYYARARDIFEQTLGSISPGLAAALLGLGRVHLQYGVPVSAAFMFERAVRIREAIEVTPVQLAGARLLLATALARTNPPEAREVLCTAMKEHQRTGDRHSKCLLAMQAFAADLART